MKKLLITLTFSIFCWGCIVPCLHPIYTEKDLVFDKGLVGVWGDEEEFWDFAKGDGKSYNLKVKVDGKPGTFVAHLVDIKGQRYLDIFPRDLDSDEQDVPLQWALCLPYHVFMRIDEIGPKLKMTTPDADWLEKHLEENPKALKHEMVEDAVVVTAKTKALQAFLAKIAKIEEAWNGLDVLERVESKDNTQE